MQISIRLFGPMAPAAGKSIVDVTIADDTEITCAALRLELTRSVPSLLGLLSACRFAVNHEFVGEDQVVGAGDEVALIGMVSGG